MKAQYNTPTIKGEVLSDINKLKEQKVNGSHNKYV